jgi:hypothetical protein
MSIPLVAALDALLMVHVGNGPLIATFIEVAST